MTNVSIAVALRSSRRRIERPFPYGSIIERRRETRSRLRVAVDGDVEVIADISTARGFETIVDQRALPHASIADEQHRTIVLRHRANQIRQRLRIDSV